MIFTLLALLAVQAAPPIVSAPPPDATGQVTVRAERPQAALADCIARRCPTAEDARATLALAEAEFRRGDYRTARETLSDGIRRTRGNAAAAPRSVAALYEASSTVNLHFGEMRDHRRGIAGMARTLRAHLPADDMQVILADVRLADMWAAQGESLLAERTYRSIEERYAERGLDRLAAFVRLRRVALLVNGLHYTDAGRLLARASTMPAADDPAVLPMRLALMARLAPWRGDMRAVERLIANLKTDPTQPPLLIGSDRPTRGYNPIAFDGSTQLRWVDVGYLITPAGQVTDVAILRSAGTTGWSGHYLKQIAERRYAPTTLPDGAPGRYRVERLTLRADREVKTGSLVKGPSGGMRVISLDLTRDNAVAHPLD